MDASLTVPSRTDLLKSVAKANKSTFGSVMGELVIVALLLSYITLLSDARDHWFTTVLVSGLMCGPALIGLLRIIFQNKKEIRDLRADIRFGDHSKSALIEIVSDVVKRMGLAPGSIRTYITREKDINAAAIQIGLKRLFPALNAIFLNRSTIHYLNAAELKSVVAHEIAHNEWHYLSWSRFYLLHLLFQVACGITISCLVRGNSTLELLIPLGIAGLLEFLSARKRSAFAHTFEYLCDDAGAVVTGIVPAINAELKIAAQSEIHSKVIAHLLKKKLDGGTITLKEGLELLEEKLPFGKFDEHEMKSALSKHLDDVAASHEQLSFKGFIAYLGVRESIEQREQIAEQLDVMNKLHSLPKLEILDPTAHPYSYEDIETLVAKIHSEPEKLLFHVENEFDSENISHPSVKKRILYLWENREAIMRDYRRGVITRQEMYSAR
jgi:Zn-dependent protease with chaperone function